MDLLFVSRGENLVKLFVDCLVRLPNLRSLEVFCPAWHAGSLTKELELECAQLPSIRDLGVSRVSIPVRGCPNVESITVSRGFFTDIEMLCTYGRRLRRVAGISRQHLWRGEFRDTFSSEVPNTIVH